MKISIVSTYYNRKQQFYQTLKSIDRFNHKDFEFIVVDDASDKEHRLEDLIKEFSFLKIIRIEPKDKWYHNPCIPFNMGIKETKGDIVILQNPECLHVHDVIKSSIEKVTDGNYITFSTYSLNKELTNDLYYEILNNNLINFFNNLPQKLVENKIGWYNHSIYRPVYFHFCSAISKQNLDLLGGFDERFANGIAMDDVEFIKRIDDMGLNKIILDDISVIHQYHEPVYYGTEKLKILRNKNSILFKELYNENKK